MTVRRKDNTYRQPRKYHYGIVSSASFVVPLFFLVILFLSLACPAIGGKNNNKKNFYDVLGVSKTCSATDLKKAYRKQCLQTHPDKVGGSEEKFKQVNKAYEILSDETKRNLYDQVGEDAVDGNGGGTHPFQQYYSGQQQQQPGGGSGTSFFRFGSGSNPQRRQGGGGFQQQQFGGMNNIDLGDLFRGATTGGRGSGGGFNLDLSELLNQLGGSSGVGQGLGGRGPGVFGGGGGDPRRQQQQQQQPKRQQQTYERDCSCSLEDLATGATKKMKVKFGKNGKVYTINLTKGAKQGTKFKFKATKDGRFPPMTFVIKEKKHPFFHRRDDDLIYRYDLSRSTNNRHPNENEVVKIELTLPNGELWTRSLSHNSSFLRAGQTLEVIGKGMPIKGGPERGNLVIEFYDSSSETQQQRQQQMKQKQRKRSMKQK